MCAENIASTTVPTEAECFEPGVGYNYGEYLDYFTTEDEVECQERCQKHMGCKFFSYYQSNNECYMKTGDKNRRNNAQVISGPRYCPGAVVNETDLDSSPCYNASTICLFGGSGDHEGNVHYGGNPVCDDNWDTNDGRVVCRQLGYHGLIKITKDSQFGRVSSRN